MPAATVKSCFHLLQHMGDFALPCDATLPLCSDAGLAMVCLQLSLCFVCCHTQVESFFAVLQPIVRAACTDTPSCAHGEAPQPVAAQLKAAQQAQLADSQQQQQQQQHKLHIVDFGCGTGNLLLPLAALFPSCTFTGVDMKPAALQLLQQRAAAAGLSNVAVFEGMIEQYCQPFDVALGLHACGNATDHVLQMAVHCGAAFVVSPCCVGE
jgi:SAM-dependent methyltransferase